LLLSALLGALSAIGGYWLARLLDANVAGSIATTAGLVFLLTFLFSPQRGVVALALRRREQRWEFAQTALAIHLFNHEGTPAMATEGRVDHLQYHLHWEPNFAGEVVRRAERGGLIVRQNGDLSLTDNGRERAQLALVN
jgi:manganese/zinc/iron transport system permease protein